MRLLRLRLAAVRGVDECEVEPARRGVTVIAGPNESGKTTLAEAFELLLDKRADSTDRTVRRLQPIGTDSGSEVEAEIETGPYRLRVFKRFNRNRETVLQVLAPAAEDLSGREAHDRLQEILAETVDLDLWRALRIEQGHGFEQAAVAGSRSLLQALEGAGCEGVGGEREESLREKAAEEYRRYFTAARGQPTGELKAALDEAVARRQPVTEAAEELAHLEADVERAARLRRRSVALAAEVETARAGAAEALERLREVERLDGEVSGRRSALKDEEGRLRLLRELAESRRADADLAGRLEAAQRALRDSLEALAPLDEALVVAAGNRTAALEELERAKAEERLATLRHRLAEIGARRERLAALAERLSELDAGLAAHPVTERALRDLEAKDRASERARAALDAASAGLRLEALAPLAAEIDGEPVTLAAGESLERRVSRPLSLTLPGVARAEVVPGRDLEALAEAVERSQAALSAACAALSVESFEDARRAHGERRLVESERAALAAEQRAAAGGVPPERLAAEAGEIERKVAALEATRSDDGPAAASSREPAAESTAESNEQAAARRSAAEEAVASAEAEHRRVVESKAERDAAVARAREVHRELSIERRHAGERLARARDGIGELIGESAGEPLASAESPGGPPPGDEPADEPAGAPSAGEAAAQLGLFVSDPRPALDGALAEAERRAERAREELAAAGERLAALEPAAVRRAAEESAAALDRARGQRGAVDRELAEVRGRLEVRGEGGLFDREAEARSALAAAERRARSLGTRAAAARKLHQALESARESARDAYSEPLRRAIEETARPLFGDRFAVELDDELRITRRTLDGVTLELERLSAGAREQLALISRLACARLAAPSGGVPVILDDALGHTDRERLTALGEVLSRVADDVQVIVLTSEPERFQSVGGARALTVGRHGG